jgi:uridine phosphorylase
MKRLMISLVVIMCLFCLPAVAQQQQTFGDYEVHYSAFNSSMLTAEVAKAYSIQRSDSRAVINISVLKRNADETLTAVKSIVTASGRNLTGQTREVDMREINEQDEAIYYIGELSVRNMEMFDFTVLVTPEGRNQPMTVKFRQQFYTE